MKYVSVRVVNINEILAEYVANLNSKKCYFMVIGANDGKLEDFLTSYFDKLQLTGILVEPVASLYERLCERFFSYQNLFLENSAVDTKTKTRTIYKLKEISHFPEWTKGLASFKKKVILSHQDEIADIMQYIVEEKVTCVTIASLLKKYQFPALNILQIDTEGYDFEIIKSINFELTRPDIIIFEHMHLTYYIYYAAVNYLNERNYFVARNHNTFDLIAIDNRLVPHGAS
jgi:FkbM family methyltransferase